MTAEPPLPTRKPIGIILAGGYGATTVSLWVAYFMGLLVIYLLTGWLPTIMKDAGLSISTAANVTAMFQIAPCGVATVYEAQGRTGLLASYMSTDRSGCKARG